MACHPKTEKGKSSNKGKNMKLVYAITVHTKNTGRRTILHALTEECCNYTNLNRGFRGYETSLTVPL